MSDFIPVGFAAFFVWWVLAYSTLLDKPLSYPRDHWSPLVMCSFCLGFWIVLLIQLLRRDYDPVTLLAAAGLVGALGSVTT